MAEEKSLTLKDSLELEEFDPMNIDISEFKRLSEQLPQDTNIDIAIAEKFAGIYLRAADRCSEIHSALLHHTSRMKTEKNTTRQKLYLAAKDEGHKTVEERKAYAESHDDYVAACEALTKAEMAKSWFEDKHKWFLKSHQYMKEKLKSEQQHMRSSGFNEIIDDKNYGEKEW
jgi:hypothetical protein